MQKFIIATLFVLTFFFICGATAFAANKIFTGPGNFSDATKWNGNSLPAAGDNLRINGTCTFDNTANNLAYGTLVVGNTSIGTLNWPVGGTNILNVTAVSSSQAGSAIDMTNGGTLQIHTSWTTTNQTFTPGAGTIVWNVTGANSTLPAAITTYNNLTITATGRTASLGVATTLNGNLLISAGTLSVSGSNFALNVKGNFTNNGTFTQGNGTVTLNGIAAQTIGGTTVTTFNNLTISNTNAAVLANTNFSVAGTLTVNASATLSPAAGVVVSGAGTLTGSGTVQVTRITATADFSSQYTITTKTLTNLTVEYAGAGQVLSSLTYGSAGSGGLKVSGSITGASNTATVGGVFTITGTFTPTSGTITMTGGSISNSGTLSFNGLTISGTTTGSGNFSVGGTMTVNGTFTPAAADIVSGGGTLTGSGTVQVTRITATADFSSQYTITNKTLSNLTVEYAGSSTQTVSALTYGTLKVNNSNGVTLAGSTTVNGALTLTSGNVTTVSFAIIIGSSGIVSHTNGHVVGNLRKEFASGIQSFTFDVGDATNYTPVAIASFDVTTPGNVTAKTTSTEHPNVGTSGINSAKSVNRFWTLTAGGGIAFTMYDATFSFVSADVDSNATAVNFVIRRFDGTNWFATTSGTKTATSTQATGISSLSDFAIGEQIIDHYAVSAASSQTAGIAFLTTVTAQDILNETVTSDNNTVVTMSGSTGNVQFDSNSDGTFSDNTKALTAGTFTISTKDSIAETINITATDGNSKTGIRTGVVINPGTAAQLAFIQQPTDTVAGTVISPSVTVQLKDTQGNNVPTAGVSITMSLSSGTGILSGTTSKTTNASGLATFNDLSINLTGSKNLTASSTGLTSAVSNAFTISAGTATKVIFAQQPSDTTAGDTISPAVTVQLQDVSGNNVSTAGVSITMSLSSGTGILSGTTPKTTNASGLATFSDLSINLAGSKNLTASSTGLTSAVSNAFTISAGTATKVIFAQQPSDTTAGDTISPAVTVQLQDVSGNNVSTAGVSITMSLSSGTGILSGTTPKTTNASGLATFSDLSINLAGSKNLTASSDGLPSAISNTFTISVGTATKVVFVQQPSDTTAGATISPAVTVQLQDVSGNNVSTSGVSITMSLSSGTGILSGTTPKTTNASGLATFNDLSINLAGSKNLTASSDGLTSAISNAFTISAGTATKVRVETAANGSGTVVPSQSIVSGSSITVYAITRDASDNFVANVAADAWSLENIMGGVVSGDIVPGGDNKNAVFTGHFSGTAQTKATSGSLATTNSGTLTVTAGVSLTSPANNETGVAINRAITATFTEAMDDSTITTATFTVSDGSGNISGAVSSSGTTTTFTPLSNMSPSITYTATITTGVKNLAGIAIASNYTWIFTTGTVTDTTPPTVSSTSPANGATGVAINTAITATFSEAMSVSTITADTFTVSVDGSVISGTVSYNTGQKKATFTPSSNLSNSTAYTAMITTEVEDEAGNAMASDYHWSFTTASGPDTTPPTVSSTSPMNGATGVSVSTTITATFSEEMDASAITTATFSVGCGCVDVSGTVSYNSGQKTATFTPSGNLSNSTAYSAMITTEVKDVAGNAMASDYHWSFTTASAAPGPGTTPPTVSSTSPIRGATGVAVSTTITATFSEEMDASTINTDTFTVGSGGGNVSGTVSYNSGQKTATFTPSGNLSNSTAYSAMITTGAKDVAGNAMSSAYTWGFTTVSAPVSIAPPSAEKFMIISTSPLNGDTDVRIDTTVSATFSMYVNGYTLTTGTFKLSDGDNEVYGSVTTNGATATFTPSENLAYNTKYSATITTGAQAANWAGTTLDSNYTWSFTTIMDTEPPTVISISPAIGATDVSLDSVISVTFSEEMDASTITTDTFEVSVGSNKIDGTISYNGTTATLTPSNNLLSSTTYTVEITTDVKDLAGNAMASHYHSSFTTISGPDTTPPTVVSTSPANGATDVSLDSVISVTFSEEMDASTITTDTFDVSVGSNKIDGTISYNGTTATLTPSNNLFSSTTYTVEITTDVKDLAGNAMASHYHSSFTTVSLPITPMPTPTQEPTPALTPALTPVPTPLPSPVNKGVVFGFVFDERGMPLKGVTTTVTGTAFSMSTKTDEDGHYEFSNLAAGDYTLTYKKEGYQTQTRDINLGEGEALDIGTIIMKLIVKGKIYGYVVNRKGNPIESVKLSLKGKRLELSKTLFSDQNGYFEFTDLEADTYVIILKKRGYKRNKQTVKLEEGEEKEIEIVMKNK